MEFHEFAEAIARVAVIRSGRAVQAVGTTEVRTRRRQLAQLSPSAERQVAAHSAAEVF